MLQSGPLTKNRGLVISILGAEKVQDRDIVSGEGPVLVPVWQGHHVVRLQPLNPCPDWPVLSHMAQLKQEMF